MSDEHSCPNCGTNEAVPKSVAWDALATVPPKAARDLERLRNIELAARSLIEAGAHPGDAETVVVTVPKAFLDSLAMTFGMPEFPTMLESYLRGGSSTTIEGGKIPTTSAGEIE